jgi:hypothetical protein
MLGEKGQDGNPSDLFPSALQKARLSNALMVPKRITDR